MNFLYLFHVLDHFKYFLKKVQYRQIGIKIPIQYRQIGVKRPILYRQIGVKGTIWYQQIDTSLNSSCDNISSGDCIFLNYKGLR